MAERRTAGEAGWQVSRYNLSAPLPGTNRVAIANLYAGSCAEYGPAELYLMSVLDELDEHHPIIDRLAARGLICNFDERAALETLGRAAAAAPTCVSLTICPTMGCNFDCPYCFESHRQGRMSEEVQDDVVALAERLLDASGARRMHVTWFGGEPLLAPDVIEALSARLVALAEGRGVAYAANIVTNGYLLTQDVADLLGRARVEKAQVTLDGLGATHDLTRRLAGGGGSFERIVGNLRDLRLPFPVEVRHNVHEGNRAEVDELRAFVEGLAAESGNQLSYYAAPVIANAAADERGGELGLLCDGGPGEVAAIREARRFSHGRGHFCAAQTLWGVGVDERGRLHKCWEAVDKAELAFGRAHDWDPANPLATAERPDLLTCFLNTAAPVGDGECRACVWLPHCAGGCPYQRLFESHRACVPYRDDPEAFVLALHARIGRKQ